MKFEVLRTILLLFLLGFGSLLRAQDVEIEPNQPCASAQGVGLVSLPFTMTGSLDPALGEEDVDFFSFEGLPGSGVRIDLEGLPTGKGAGRPVPGLLRLRLQPHPAE